MVQCPHFIWKTNFLEKQTKSRPIFSKKKTFRRLFSVEKKTTLMHFSSYLAFCNFALIAALESNYPVKIPGSLVIKDDLVV